MVSGGALRRLSPEAGRKLICAPKYACLAPQVGDHFLAVAPEAYNQTKRTSVGQKGSSRLQWAMRACLVTLACAMRSECALEAADVRNFVVDMHGAEDSGHGTGHWTALFGTDPHGILSIVRVPGNVCVCLNKDALDQAMARQAALVERQMQARALEQVHEPGAGPDPLDKSGGRGVDGSHEMQGNRGAAAKGFKRVSFASSAFPFNQQPK
eukprot:scaffold127741_cov18-Tisochrysis_lutea.AAC.1